MIRALQQRFSKQIGCCTKVDVPQALFKGADHAVISLITGEVAVQFPTSPTVIVHVKIGKVCALAVTTSKRMPALPDLPTIEFANRSARNEEVGDPDQNAGIKPE